ncbi:putative esterase [Spirochaeta africana]|uniref:Putative esterase n=1 Tax=Spirochaeta africana (strain ATCC 700263 / DSM 8902 / Z-7692) TaxID=889378 RepID=H9UM62_SPIAZ|nr:putative esterase [Spirochaeta africana]AFG38605.1 putative esterase [Spirochaeta africana DSM 8902]
MRTMRAAAAVLMICAVLPVFGQARSRYFDQPAQIVPPRDYDSSRRYPAIVFLPYTTGTAAAQARSFGIPPGEQDQFVVILPAGRFTRDDYLPNFIQFVEWFEERLLQDLDTAKQNISIDPDRVYLAGYSLGGDLGWALTARNPQRFAGAVMAGTRASYPMTEGSRRNLSANGYRGAFLIGDREDTNRSLGIERAHALLDDEGIETMFRTYRGGHQIPPRELLQESVAFVTTASVAADWTGGPGDTRRSSAPAAGSGVNWERALDIVALRTPTQHFGLRWEPGFEIGAAGFQRSPWHAGSLRAEGLFDDIYLRGVTSVESRRTSGQFRQTAIRQEAALAYGRGALWGAGITWDWNRWMSTSNEDLEELGSDALREFAISGFWIHPRRMRDIPSSVLELRYSVPRTLRPFIPQHVFNAELRYRLHVTDRILLQAAAGSSTEQNRPFTSTDQLDTGLDHVLSWQAGIGARIPGPFRWHLLHHGRWVKPLQGDPLGYDASWRFALEYLF